MRADEVPERDPRSRRPRVAVGIGWSGAEANWSETVDFVRCCEDLGVDVCWAPEAWADDAVSPLAYLAAVTSKIQLGAGVFQISARVPVLVAMTARSLASMSNDRFLLGLGVSGPQVVEGLHGVSFAHPHARLREYIDVVRLALSGAEVVYDGDEYQLPRPGGLGKRLRLAGRPLGPSAIPLYLGTLGPRGLELVGETADGWIGTSFMPEVADVFFEHIQAGARRAGRRFEEIDIQSRGLLAFGDPEQLFPEAKRKLAFTLSAMGPRGRNFYAAAYARSGFVEEVAAIQDRWAQGDRRGATALVPDELVHGTHFLGSDDDVEARIRAHAAAGVSTIRFEPMGASVHERLEVVARAMNLVDAMDTDLDERAPIRQGRSRP